MRWVGIDEAGYGPNLGPLVMTAVVAEGPDDRPPDVWGDLARSVARAGGASDRLWVDDSKKIYKAGQGRDRLDASTLATLAATGRILPKSLGGLVESLGAGTLDEVELAPWLDAGDPRFPPLGSRSMCQWTVARRPFEQAPWRVVDIRSIIVGPRQFNAGLEAHGSKAVVHFSAFAGLLTHLRKTTTPDHHMMIKSDKHGGRHFYGDPLAAAFPDVRVDRGPEGPDLSRYELIEPSGRKLTLSLLPRADAEDGLVALASIISKAVREHWMDAFNAHWQARLPSLRPTAGYPVDAARFRQAIEPLCLARGLRSRDWWRAK
jgi:ribonuclease HII